MLPHCGVASIFQVLHKLSGRLLLVVGYAHKLDVKLQCGEWLDIATGCGAIAHIVRDDNAATVANVHARHCYAPPFYHTSVQAATKQAIAWRRAHVGRINGGAIVETQVILHVDHRRELGLEVALGLGGVVKPVY